MLKQIADVLAPYITQLFNRSLIGGHFPAVFKEAFITPIVKKPGLDTTELRIDRYRTCRTGSTHLLRIVFPKTNGYSNEYQTVVIKLLLNRNIQNIKQK